MTHLQFNVTRLIQLPVSYQLVSHAKMKYYCTSNSSTVHLHSKRSVLAPFSTNTVPRHLMWVIITIRIRIKMVLLVERMENTVNARQMVMILCLTLWLMFAKKQNTTAKVRIIETAQSPSNIHSTTRCSRHLLFHPWRALSRSSGPVTWLWSTHHQLQSPLQLQCHHHIKNIKTTWAKIMSTSHRH